MGSRKGRIPVGENAGLLRALVPTTPHLYLRNNRVATKEMYDVPVNEHGLVQMNDFVRVVLGSVALGHAWRGFSDEHHVYWPRLEYNLGNGGGITANFRELPSNKLYAPRQMHEYIHLVTNKPQKPAPDVMRQYLIETDVLRGLWAVVTPSEEERKHGYLDPINESQRQAVYHSKLEQTIEPQVGHLPPIEQLWSMTPAEAHIAIIGLIGRYEYKNDVTGITPKLASAS